MNEQIELCENMQSSGLERNDERYRECNDHQAGVRV